MEENVAVMVNIEIFNTVIQYLSTQPFNEVAGLIQSMGQSPGLTQTQIGKLREMPEASEEKAPE